MQRHRQLLVAGILAVASLGGATTTSAHQLVDGTTLVPPVGPSVPCYEAGRRVKCDTSTNSTYVNLPGEDFGCGTIYLTGSQRGHATRWYENGLLVERIVQWKVRDSWSLSPTGAGPSLTASIDQSWDENFLIPGDLSSDVEVTQGNFIRIQGLGGRFIESGRYLADGTFHGYTSAFTDASLALICDLLTP